MGSIPGRGTKIPHATWRGQKKKKITKHRKTEKERQNLLIGQLGSYVHPCNERTRSRHWQPHRKEGFTHKEEECCYQKKMARHAVQTKPRDAQSKFGIIFLRFIYYLFIILFIFGCVGS